MQRAAIPATVMAADSVVGTGTIGDTRALQPRRAWWTRGGNTRLAGHRLWIAAESDVSERALSGDRTLVRPGPGFSAAWT